MKGFVGLTDFDWYTQFLASSPDEVNFWRPLGGRAFKALQPSEPFFFKLKSAHGGAIAGFGLFAGFTPMRVAAAWELFGESNGVPSESAMRARIEHYVRRNRGTMSARHEIGCIILTTPVFFPPSHHVQPPSGWKPNIVTGAGYDVEVGEGKRIWAECLERAADLHGSDEALTYNLGLAASAVEFRERVSRQRLGQGGFRAMVTSAYQGTCAVSGDHTLPVLEAAHIRGVGQGGRHEIGNGLLLRADIHKLFDLHLVTVTPEHEFRVSDRLREEYANGTAYYALQGRPLHLPAEVARQPRAEFLEEHRDCFLRAG